MSGAAEFEVEFLTDEMAFDAEFESLQKLDEIPAYEGAYETEACFREDVVLPTKGKLMNGDFTVKQIERTLSFNDAGGMTIEVSGGDIGPYIPSPGRPPIIANKVIIDGETLVDLTADTVTKDNIAKGVTAHDKSGAKIVGDNKNLVDTSDADALPDDILKGRTAYVGGVKTVGKMPVNDGFSAEITTKDAEVEIPEGYHDGTGKVSIADAAKAALTAENIRAGVAVLGVDGTLKEGEPITAASEAEMNALKTADNNGVFVKFTGESTENFREGAYYKLSAAENGELSWAFCGLKLIEVTFTENGTYEAAGYADDTGEFQSADGFRTVTVNVPLHIGEPMHVGELSKVQELTTLANVGTVIMWTNSNTETFKSMELYVLYRISGNLQWCHLVTEPKTYIEATYDAGGYMLTAALHGFTKIVNNQFRGQDKLTSVTYDKAITEIGDYAFAGTKECLPASVIPSTVQKIGISAFEDSSMPLTTLPSGVTEIGESAFADSSMALTSLPSGLTAIPANAFQFTHNMAFTSLPAGVTSIGKFAFYFANVQLTALPDAVTTMGDSAFYHSSCPALTKLSNGLAAIPETAFYEASLDVLTSLGTGLHMIGDNAFDSATAPLLTSLPDGLTTIGNGAFMRSSAPLASMPNTVTDIGYAAFYNSSAAFTSLSTGLTQIKDSTFDGCSNLTLTSLPSGLTLIYGGAFRDCSGITISIIPDGVTTIGDAAFQACTGITQITLPSGLDEIGGGVFASCTSLTEVTFKSTPAHIGNNIFGDCPNLTTVRVPWAEGTIAMGAIGIDTSKTTVIYNYTAE